MMGAGDDEDAGDAEDNVSSLSRSSSSSAVVAEDVDGAGIAEHCAAASSAK
tara:strand:- start:1 stop:153 length:153 start_codon:yes stop_codon:yes gene_type:complete